MGGDRLNENLKRLHAQSSPDFQHQQALEEELLLRFRNNKSQKKRWINFLNPHNAFARFAVLGLAMLLLGVGACSETITEVEVGKKVSISLRSGDPNFDESIDLNARIKELNEVLSNSAGVKEINFSVSDNISENGTNTDLSFVLFGDSLDDDVLINLINNDFPDLASAEITIENLQGTITENWAKRFGREVFHIETDGSTDEEIQAQVLQQLADQGFGGEAKVIVNTEGEMQTIEININQEGE